VLANLRVACEAHNRTFNVMYDLSGSTGAKEKGLKEFISAALDEGSGGHSALPFPDSIGIPHVI
jgi:hypothetical protein